MNIIELFRLEIIQQVVCNENHVKPSTTVSMHHKLNMKESGISWCYDDSLRFECHLILLEGG